MFFNSDKLLHLLFIFCTHFLVANCVRAPTCTAVRFAILWNKRSVIAWTNNIVQCARLLVVLRDRKVIGVFFRYFVEVSWHILVRQKECKTGFVCKIALLHDKNMIVISVLTDCQFITALEIYNAFPMLFLVVNAYFAVCFRL